MNPNRKKHTRLLFHFFFFALLTLSAQSDSLYNTANDLYFQTTEKFSVPTEWNIKINELSNNNQNTIANENGAFESWIEIYNYGNQPININGIYISDDPEVPNKWQINNNGNDKLTTIAAQSQLLLWADAQTDLSPMHLGFRLKKGNGELTIYNTDLSVIDKLTYENIPTDKSYGLHPTMGVYNYFDTASPGMANHQISLLEVVPVPIPTSVGGFYNTTQIVSLNCSLNPVEIYYTLDGSLPDESSNLYTGPINISNTTILRFSAYKNGYIPSPSTNHSYFFDNNTNFATISLVTDESNWTGPDGINEIPNRSNGIEKPVHIEFFESEGERVFAINAGMKIHAPDSRPQQSLRIYARDSYGTSKMAHQIFPDKDINTFKRIVLRNGGNDGAQLGGTHFRDALVHEVFKEQRSGNIYAAYRPAHVYINGNYWGIYNIRERQDKHFIKSNFNETDIDFLERSANAPDTRDVWAGDWEAYNALEDYLYNNDMSLAVHSDYALQQIDFDNAIDYYLTEIYTGNRDWITNNIKFWKKRTGGKWRWVLWDTEYGMGNSPNANHGLPPFNSLRMAVSWGGWDLSTANYGKNTRFLRHLVGFEGHFNADGDLTIEAAEPNPIFKQKFISRCADLLNMHQREAYMSTKIDDFKALLAPEIQRQFDRWGRTMEEWEDNIEVLRNYTNERPPFVRVNVLSQLNIDTEYLLDLDVFPSNAGNIKLNTIKPKTYPWDGYYFSQVPVHITAQPKPGYEFVSWNDGSITTPTHIFTASEAQSFTANFEEISSDVSLVINEINYKANAEFDTEDWIEIYNPTTTAIDVSNWSFNDNSGDNSYTFVEGTVIESGAYMVLCKNLLKFRSIYSQIENVIGDFNFDLSNAGELIRLYDDENNLIDQVDYGVTNPWSELPNGYGATLELIQATWDNELPESWQASYTQYGTPGAINSDISQQVYLSITDQQSFNFTQNFPNPFSNSTTIRFQIKSAGNLTLNIYNINGQQVYHKNNYFNEAGIFDIEWTPENLESGLYYYQIQTKDNYDVKKMLYIK